MGGWGAAVVFTLIGSIALSASLSTTILLAGVAIAPAIVIAMLAKGAQPPTVAQILHPGDTTDRR
jgi:hypothetical protein